MKESNEHTERLIVLDTETTGLDTAQGHRIIEIGAVELVARRLTGNNYHQYIQPQRLVDAGAFEVHGISDQFLEDKPLFADIVDNFSDYLAQGETTLVIHNAPFDVGFLDHEFKLAGLDVKVETLCSTVVDSLKLARKQFPGKRNTLDALCDRLGINNGHRKLHGALLDSEILADVFLIMTGGQEAMNFGDSKKSDAGSLNQNRKPRGTFKVHHATEDELTEHQLQLDLIGDASNDGCLWKASIPS